MSQTISARFILLISALMAAAILLTASPAPGARVTNAGPSGGSGARDPETKVTIDFRDVDVRVVAKFISELTGKNFVFDKQVRDKVTVYSPTEVSAEEAYRLFETVLKIHGYTTVPSEGVIKIVPSQEARTMDVETRPFIPDESRSRDDRVVTQLIRLQYADAMEMRALLQPLMGKSGVLMAYDSGNTLIVTDYASNINRLLEILDSVDREDKGTKLSIIHLEYASAKDLAAELEEVLQAPAARGKNVKAAALDYKVVSDQRTNNLIVLARAAETAMIRELVRKLDVPSPRGSDRIHVLFLKNAVAEDLAATLNELTSAVSKGGNQQAQGKAPARLVLQEEVFITHDAATNALIVRAERQDFLVLKSIIEQLDIQRAQVLVEGIIMEMTLSKAQALGAEWRLLDWPEDGSDLSAFGGTNLPGSGESTGLINQLATTPYGGPGGLILGAAEGTISWGGTTYLNIGALVQALQQDSEVNILSTPHILTMDNTEASIVVGQERPFLQSSLSTATGDSSTSITNTYEFKDLGLTLKITPHITQGEYIKLEIYQELKSFIGEAETGAISSTKRETETTVQVRNGETVVIGGLIGDETRATTNQTPCIGDVPLFGWAFKRRNDSSEKLNLLILIRPTIIRTAEQLNELTDRKKRESEEAGRREKTWWEKNFGPGGEVGDSVK